MTPHLLRRNLLVIPGVLLMFHAIVVMGYLGLLRQDNVAPCFDAELFEYDGVCYRAWKVLLVPLLVGATMAAAGVLAFPPAAHDHRRWGTGTHATFAVLLSLVLLPMGALAAQVYREATGGSRGSFVLGSNTYVTTFLLLVAVFVALLPFGTFSLFWAAQVRNARREDRRREHRRASFAPLEPLPEAPAVTLEPQAVRDISGKPISFTYIDLDDGEKPA